MDTDDLESFEDITKIKTYADFLDKFVTKEDLIYLEDEELARDVKELYAVNKGDIRCKADFDRKKKEIELANKEEDTKERDPFSKGMTYKKGSFLELLQERESEVRNGRKSTIIYIRYKESKGKETSAYIDYRERLKNDDMEFVFKGQKDLIPRPTDLSYYNWTLQKVMSNDSTFFRVDAGPKERLSFKNNTDRKIINVDLEYLEKHPNSDVRRLPVNLKMMKDGKVTITQLDAKKENRRRKMKKGKEDDEEEKENETLGYQQIVIFDYETRSK
jgi:hypothetical protein